MFPGKASRASGDVLVDFLDFHWHGAHWPAFNLADVTISAGTVCLIIAGMYQIRLSKTGVKSG